MKQRRTVSPRAHPLGEGLSSEEVIPALSFEVQLLHRLGREHISRSLDRQYSAVVIKHLSTNRVADGGVISAHCALSIQGLQFG